MLSNDDEDDDNIISALTGLIYMLSILYLIKSIQNFYDGETSAT